MRFIKIIMALGILTLFATTATASQAPEPVRSPYLVNLKGIWFLRSADNCIEKHFNRKGRSEASLEESEMFIDKRDDYLYLTVKRYPHTYTYRMNPIVFGKSYVLELIAIAPQEWPTSKSKPMEPLTGIFRKMVDCQIGPPEHEIDSVSVYEQDVTQ